MAKGFQTIDGKNYYFNTGSGKMAVGWTTIGANKYYFDEETGVIVTAISRHRDPEAAKEKNLNGILYRADKASRACFACDAEKDCNWKDGKKNLTIKY